MRKIISASRRCDVPAFCGDKFLKALDAGYAVYKNPYNKKDIKVSLKNEDVAAFVFWSKNFTPFTEYLKEIKSRGFDFYFNYTINNYPYIFEPDLPVTGLLVENLKYLSMEYSPDAINWRYDPIILSDLTDMDFHLANFKGLAELLKGYTRRCIISFVSLYKKVSSNFKQLEKKNNIKIIELEITEKIKLANALADIADDNNMILYSCCNDFLVQGKIKQSSCIDGNLINELFFKNKFEGFEGKVKPTRNGCGCYESADIGEYDSCKHNCIYCYANKGYKI